MTVDMFLILTTIILVFIDNSLFSVITSFPLLKYIGVYQLGVSSCISSTRRFRLGRLVIRPITDRWVQTGKVSHKTYNRPLGSDWEGQSEDL